MAMREITYYEGSTFPLPKRKNPLPVRGKGVNSINKNLIKVKNQIQHLIENKAFENPKTP